MREMWISANKDRMSVASLKASDYVTTTGRKLQQTFRNFNPNVSIFRNMFDWAQPQWHLLRERADDGTILIGWVGLTSHFEDLKKMAPILKYIHDKYPQTRFVLSGMAIKDTEVVITVDERGGKKFDEHEITDETKTYKYKVKQLYKDFDPARIQFNDATELENYGKFYKDLDISLCYVEKLTFNECKSEIKAVESMYYEAIPVVMDFGGYRDLKQAMPADLKHAHHFIDSENPKRWQEAVEYWVNNLEEGKKYAQKQSEWVKENYDVNVQVHSRVEFYNDIIEKFNEKQMNQIQNILA